MTMSGRLVGCPAAGRSKFVAQSWHQMAAAAFLTGIVGGVA